MKQHTLGVMVLAMALAIGNSAAAQDGYGTTTENGGGDANPFGSGDTTGQGDANGQGDEALVAPGGADQVAYSQRALTLPQNTLRADVGFGALHFSFMGTSNTSTFLSLSAGFGVMENLEAGISGVRQGPNAASSTSAAIGLLPFQLTEDFNFGLITPYARYRLLADEMLQLAAELTIILPTAKNSDFGVLFGVPFRLMLMQMLAIDTGLFFQATFADSTITDLVIPLNVVVNVMPALFLMAGIQYSFSDFDINVMALNFGAGYTVESDGQPMLDIMAQFGFPLFLYDGNSSTDLWQLQLVASYRLGL